MGTGNHDRPNTQQSNPVVITQPNTVNEQPNTRKIKQPVATQQPNPVVITQPDTVDQQPNRKIKQPKPVATQQPNPVVITQPDTVDQQPNRKIKQPKPVATQQPNIVVITQPDTVDQQPNRKIKQPKPTATQQPNPVVITQPNPVDEQPNRKIKQPKPAATQQPNPVIITQPNPVDEHQKPVVIIEPAATKQPKPTKTPKPSKPTQTPTPVKELYSVYIPEGKLDQLVQVSPNGETLTTPYVTFQWTYTISDSSTPVDVDFSLQINIKDQVSGQVKKVTATVPSASCKKQNCSYTAGSEFAGLTKANVTWTISGTYYIGGAKKTVTAQNAGLKFKLNIKNPEPTPTKIPPVKPKPGMPIPQYPNDRTTSRSLGFYWLPSIYSDYYTVEWMNDRGNTGSMNLSNNDETCRLGLCITFATLPGPGRYAWVVTAKNNSGATRSKEMFFEIASNIPTPKPYRPNGTVFNHTYPAFEWEDIQNGTYEYHIQVIGRDDNRIRLDRWYNVNDIYIGNGVCYVQTDVFLPAGSYSWRVQARNSYQTSSWSYWLDFYVECDYCNYNNTYYNTYANTVPTCSYPVGTITTNTPDFQWRTLTGASYYMVTLYDTNGSILFDNQVYNTNCTAEICSYSPKITLTRNGNYSWSVSGYGANGSRWGSANGSFTLNAAVVLNPMKFLRPAQYGLLTADAPVIIWSDPGQTTALFHIEIFNSTNKQLFSADLNREQAWCDNQTCSIEFKSIPDAENYRITITPYSELNTAGDTISLIFSKGSAALPLILNYPQQGSVVSSRPLFRWDLDAGADAEYELLMTDAYGSQIIFTPLICGAVGVTCDGYEAFFSPADPLSSGVWTARITAEGTGYSSDDVTFTIQ